MIFDNLQKFGKKFSINRNNLSYLDIKDILRMYFSISGIKPINQLRSIIKKNKIEYYNNKNVKLPDIIISAKDLYIQKSQISKINFISNKSVTSKIINYANNSKQTFDGIICIENADPGFDFLFSKDIKGLITKYGGQNSHMAIRCAELNLPALIGVGEKVFNSIIENRFIKIDCSLKKIDLIN